MENLKSGLIECVRSAQKSYYSGDILRLFSGLQVHKTSRIISLDPYFDENGLLRARTPRTRKTKSRDTLPADHTALSSVGQADHPSRSRNCTALWQNPNPSRNTREILDHKGSGNSWKPYSKLHHLPHGKSQSYTTTDGPSPSSSSAVPHPATHQCRN